MAKWLCDGCGREIDDREYPILEREGLHRCPVCGSFEIAEIIEEPDGEHDGEGDEK